MLLNCKNWFIISRNEFGGEMAENKIIKSNKIQNKIYTIRGMQVVLDNDLALLYGVKVKRLNEQVKRNKERFPTEFCFQLNESDIDNLRSQIATSKQTHPLRSQIATLKDNRGKHRKYLPYVFTEQGVAMLAGVLKSEIAVKMSIQIIKAFVAMRKFISVNAQIFQRIDKIEIKQLETDKKIEHVLNAIEDTEVIPKKGIFFDGQIYDAYKFISGLIRTAKKTIVIIDNYVDDSVITFLIKRNKSVKVTIYTKKITKLLALDLRKHNAQYPPIEIKEFNNAHDRFMIIDNKVVYHFGASLKDLGKKWFAFSKFDK